MQDFDVCSAWQKFEIANDILPEASEVAPSLLRVMIREQSLEALCFFSGFVIVIVTIFVRTPIVFAFDFGAFCCKFCNPSKIFALSNLRKPYYF